MSPELARAIDALTAVTGPSPEAALGTRSPTFRDSDLPLLAGLAKLLLDGGDDLAMRWAERLLVFVEVRRTELRARLVEKWPASADRLLGALALEAVLLAAHASSGDLRFLNTALKLGEHLAVHEVRLRVRFRSPSAPALQIDRALRAHVDAAVAQIQPEAW